VSQAQVSNRVDRPVKDCCDHTLGPADAAITLVEYGSYACPYPRAANERIAEVRDQFGDRLGYVFRHGPVPGSDIAPNVPRNWRSMLAIPSAFGRPMSP
jgi:Na+:H+ antiporter, NhaA family